MSNTKMVCLANSFKIKAYCMAGKLINEKQWIRPVSSNATGELSRSNVTCETKGVMISPLDVVEMDLQSPRPHDHQQENCSITPNPRTRIVGRIGWEQLAEFEDKPLQLWAPGYHTCCGSNDRVPDYMVSGFITNSLFLIHVASVKFIVSMPSVHANETHLKVQVEFEYAGKVYRLRLTDPALVQPVQRLGIGSHTAGNAYVTVSLTEQFHGYCYKLAAAVFLREPI
ncbi:MULTISPECIES: hypothetical protein [unclassified Polaromonas]|uniref:dual OB domain-containing protein n=1 Tax=unclassified Polaromonas TaxID=2638319 RepID=UPI0018CAAE9C|nr:MULTISPECIES: hypothetical protein [unclassified Polaromonas]MBG6073433.1 hypothetical protein [Polaromonas sp. CG_9.7]MBG6115382.1 hypothetical protein [Polaromonas sp. CG_9.2]